MLLDLNVSTKVKFSAMTKASSLKIRVITSSLITDSMKPFAREQLYG